ncbi:MAG TPA: hypothetical protein VE076_10510, partial [Nitrososphaeraceae archaeon]|nr:hypothetical protein [Nitrososphaeraceae archaeon]
AQTADIIGTLLLTLYYYKNQIQNLSKDIETQVLLLPQSFLQMIFVILLHVYQPMPLPSKLIITCKNKNNSKSKSL